MPASSWILLFGLIPFDYDDVTVVHLEPDKGFLKRLRRHFGPC